MRLRNVSGSKEMIAADDYVIHNPEEYKGKWHDLFGNSAPIHVEIGMGKGRFLMELAVKNPQINFIGIEKYSSVLLRALEKRRETKINNLYFIRFDAEYITGIFDKNEIARIYLNFSDPWPKDRHAKRRLTSRQFLGKYEQILKAEGEVVFKTDNRILFDFSVTEAVEAGWHLQDVTYDLHHNEYAADNVMTEYEMKFTSEGKPIYKLTARRNKDKNMQA